MAKYRKPPATLSAQSRRLWTDYVKRCNFLQPEFEVLEGMFMARDEMMLARAVLQKEGFVVKMSDGSKRPHPMVNVLRDSRQSFYRGWRLLNFRTDEKRGPGRPPETDYNSFELGEEE